VKTILKRVLLSLLALVAVFALWVFKPWSEHQSWRWYTLALEGPRAELFTHWELIQAQAQLSASSNPRVYQRNTRDIDEVSYVFDDKTWPLSHYLDKANISGFMVLHNGEVRLEFYGKGLDAESRNQIWSATKSFTSTLIAMALQQGKIDSLDDPVEKYATQFTGMAYGEASIRHVMMMSSGIDYFHFKGSPDRNDMYSAIMQNGESFDAWAGALGRRVPAGTDFNYIATDTHVLSAVLRAAYGKPYVEIVQENLWQPGGFGAAQWGLDAYGHAMGHCCLSLRLQDFANLGQLYLDDLVLNDEPTVGDDWIGMVETARAPFQEPGVDAEGKARNGYSFQFWLPPGYDQEFIAAGAFGQYLWIDRKRDFVVAQFSTGKPMLFTRGESGASPDEFAAVMRAMAQLGTESHTKYQQEE
jgi:CubicO group peptidase (beta-lactamase class C family)